MIGDVFSLYFSDVAIAVVVFVAVLFAVCSFLYSANCVFASDLEFLGLFLGPSLLDYAAITRRRRRSLDLDCVVRALERDDWPFD